MDSLVSKYYRYRSTYWRWQRILFPSPAEVRFIEIMGGKVWTFNRVRSTNTGFPLTLVVSLGKVLKRQNYKREVRYGKYFVDFSNDLNRIIEVDGREWHMDVVADMDREIYIKMLLQKNPVGMRLLRIKAYQIYNNSAEVQRKVMDFVS